MHNPTIDTGSLLMREGVELYGGFSGTESQMDQRNWEGRMTTIDGTTSLEGDRAIHVVVRADSAVLDGFTITGGKAAGLEQESREGGGLLCLNTSPTLANCLFFGNESLFGGGAINFVDAGSARLENVRFVENIATYAGAAVQLVSLARRHCRSSGVSSTGIPFNPVGRSARITRQTATPSLMYMILYLQITVALNRRGVRSSYYNPGLFSAIT